MEHARDLFDYIAIAIIAFVLLAMLALLFRTLTLVLGFLSLPVAESLERWTRWRRRRASPDSESEQR